MKRQNSVRERLEWEGGETNWISGRLASSRSVQLDVLFGEAEREDKSAGARRRPKWAGFESEDVRR